MIGYWHYNHLVERDVETAIPQKEYPPQDRYETVLCVRKVTIDIDEHGLYAYYTENSEKTLVPFEQVYPKINYRATRYSNIE